MNNTKKITNIFNTTQHIQVHFLKMGSPPTGGLVPYLYIYIYINIIYPWICIRYTPRYVTETPFPMSSLGLFDELLRLFL